MLKKIRDLFAERALTSQEQDALEKEIQYTARKLGFSLTEETDTTRTFKRELDGAVATVSTREQLNPRDYTSLHQFDCYL